MTPEIYRHRKSLHLPESPGVYIMRGARGEILYIGKAGNLKRRVSSYFQKSHDYRIERLVGEIKKVGYQKTDTALEALILESTLIKKCQPLYNIRDKDDKSFLYVEITRDPFPQVLLVRGHSPILNRRFGPFTSGGSIREALKILRKIFPFSVHPVNVVGTFSRPCFDYQIGLCPGTCVNAISRKDYQAIIHNLILFFEGQKKRIIKDARKDMGIASKHLEFEKAAMLRRQLFALSHIQDIALLKDSELPSSLLATPRIPLRIEGYDISNISGTSAVGSMVVFQGDEPDKNEYRKFRIRTIHQSDDTGMMREMLRRRFKNNWPLPHCILVDGGKGQVHVAEEVLREAALRIPVIGIAKGPTRKKNEVVGGIPSGVSLPTLIRVRDEAHRFAISYHRALRGRRFIPNHHYEP